MNDERRKKKRRKIEEKAKAGKRKNVWQTSKNEEDKEEKERRKGNLTIYDGCNRATFYLSYILEKERGSWEPLLFVHTKNHRATNNRNKKNTTYKSEKKRTRPGDQRCVLKPLFHFSFFYNFFIFSLSSSPLPPRRSSLFDPSS